MTQRKFTNELEAAIEHGIDVRGRRIFLHGDVGEDSIGTAIRGLYVMSDLSKDPIELFVTSYGGEIDESFALHDVCRTIKVPVHTVALGKCMSAAPLLVAAGEPGERYASENTIFMLHSASIDLGGSVANIASTAKAEKDRCERMDRLLAIYTSMDYRHWAKFSRGDIDHYFDAEQALAWGLIDHIWSEKS